MEQSHKICCFTGHRKLPAESVPAIKAALESVLDKLIGSGVTVFRTGGALGFDTLAALAVLEKKASYPEIKLELCLPCRDQTAKWDKVSVDFYNKILERADYVTVLHDRYVDGCMLERNRFMVDGSTYCIAFCKNENAFRSGTSYTVRYAKSHGVSVINLFR